MLLKEGLNESRNPKLTNRVSVSVLSNQRQNARYRLNLQPAVSRQMNERLQKAQARHEELVADLTEKQNANIELQIRKLTIDNERERKHLDRIEKYWWYRLSNSPYRWGCIYGFICNHSAVVCNMNKKPRSCGA